jgi:hypothetical protein
MLTKALLKHAQCAYIYEDGHGALVHKKKDRDAGEVHWVTLHETLGFKVGGFHWNEDERQAGRMEPRGRLIVGEHALPMLLAVKKLYWSGISTANGSPNSQKRGLAVGTIGVNFMDDGWRMTHFHVLDCISNDFTPQVGSRYAERWEDVKGAYDWGGMRVGQIFHASNAKKEAA